MKKLSLLYHITFAAFASLSGKQQAGKHYDRPKNIYNNNHTVYALCSCFTPTPQKTLTVEIGSPVYYVSEHGDHFVARYGSLSDNSLHFVKVKMPDKREYTLPQVVSASGVRYTDERAIVWWTHQGTVRVDVRGEDGKWKTKYPELREVTGEN